MSLVLFAYAITATTFSFSFSFSFPSSAEGEQTGGRGGREQMEKKRWRGCCERVGGREGGNCNFGCRFCGGSKDFVTFRCIEWRTIRLTRSRKRQEDPLGLF